MGVSGCGCFGAMAWHSAGSWLVPISKLLFLFPQALGLHAHKEGESHEEDNDFIWKALVVLASVYAFFLFETLMHLGLKSKLGDHGHSHVDIEVNTL